MSRFKVTRTIHPIGHGAFYTELIEYYGSKCHIVYDCGSKSKNRVDDEIDRTFRVDEKILAVFISHLDKDHVNGLEHLLNRCKVKYVFLPLLTEDEKWALMLDDENKDIWDLIADPRGTINRFSDTTFVIEVSYPYPFEDEPVVWNDNKVFVLDPEQEKMDDGFREVIPSGTCIQISGVNEWVYVPYNINADAFATRVHNQLRSKGFPTYSPEDYPALSRNERLQVQTALSNVVKKRNENSMTVYSGLSDEERGQHTMHLEYQDAMTITIVKLSGCLYLGDFKLTPSSTESLFKYYRQYSKNIFAIQVPHHGARKNFHEHILGYFPVSRIYFVSAPENDTGKHHPSGDVLRLLLRNDRFVKHISEAEESGFQMCFEIES